MTMVTGVAESICCEITNGSWLMPVPVADRMRKPPSSSEKE